MVRRPKNLISGSPLRRQSKGKRVHRRAGKRHRAGETRQQGPFVPPEDWHEPQPETDEYVIVEQSPGANFRHILSASDVRDRLGLLPEHLLEPLQAVQLSRMTRKKRTFPCYGMQWGCAIYLYPIEETLVEHYDRPPTPKEWNDTRMFGGKWEQQGARWRLVWSEATIRDFYLNSVLIHELGHLLDERNKGYADRERFADWFAIEHGYRPTRRHRRRRSRGPVRRRHHR